jgi:hypothetical protein
LGGAGGCFDDVGFEACGDGLEGHENRNAVCR